jgi:hypothetical protein
MREHATWDCTGWHLLVGGTSRWAVQTDGSHPPASCERADSVRGDRYRMVGEESDAELAAQSGARPLVAHQARQRAHRVERLSVPAAQADRIVRDVECTRGAMERGGGCHTAVGRRRHAQHAPSARTFGMARESEHMQKQSVGSPLEHARGFDRRSAALGRRIIRATPGQRRLEYVRVGGSAAPPSLSPGSFRISAEPRGSTSHRRRSVDLIGDALIADAAVASVLRWRTWLTRLLRVDALVVGSHLPATGDSIRTGRHAFDGEVPDRLLPLLDPKLHAVPWGELKPRTCSPSVRG